MLACMCVGHERNISLPGANRPHFPYAGPTNQSNFKMGRSSMWSVGVAQLHQRLDVQSITSAANKGDETEGCRAPVGGDDGAV